MTDQGQVMLRIVAKELRMAEDDLLRQGLRSFLKHQLRVVKAEIFTLSGRYGVSSVEEMEARYQDGTLVLQRDFTPTNKVVAHVVFDATDTPHSCAFGGSSRPPKPRRCRMPVWARPPSTRDAPAAGSNRSLFF